MTPTTRSPGFWRSPEGRWPTITDRAPVGWPPPIGSPPNWPYARCQRWTLGSTRCGPGALASLGDDDREVLTLTYWEGLTAEQVATVFGIGPARARKRLQRARERLSARMTGNRGPSAGRAETMPWHSPGREAESAEGRPTSGQRHQSAWGFSTLTQPSEGHPRLSAAGREPGPPRLWGAPAGPLRLRAMSALHPRRGRAPRAPDREHRRHRRGARPVRRPSST